jgi:hypothetical protein
VITRPPNNRFLRCVASFVLIFFGLSICPIGPILLPSSAAGPEQLEEAQRSFEFAEYDKALNQVETLIQGGLLTGNDLRDAHLLKGRCLLAMDREPEALISFCEAMKVDSIWQPDTFEFKTDEIEAFNRARDTCDLETREKPEEKERKEGEKKGPSKLLYYLVGGVVLVAGAVALAAGGGGGDGDGNGEEELPGFPDPPEN